MTSSASSSRIAVVLFNLGGPDSPQAIAPFLFNLFNDPAIIGLPSPFRTLLAALISRRRAPEARKIYEFLGGASPLVPNTRVQAEALERALQQRLPDGNLRCFLAMRYWHPRAAAAAAEIRAWGADRIVLLPLYPQFSTTTTGSSLKEWAKVARRAGLAAPVSAVCCYPRLPGLAAATAALLRDKLSELTPDQRARCRVLFSAHGLPKKIVAKGDPYAWQVEQTAAGIVRILGPEMPDWRVSYQSRVGPLEWIRPYTEDEIRQAGEEGRPLVVVPVAFVSEHSETLVELDIEYRELAAAHGVPVYLRVPAPAAAPVFMEGLADMVVSLLAQPPRAGGDAALCSAEGGRLCPAGHGACPLPMVANGGNPALADSANV